MVVEENLRNKNLYKIFLLFLKFLPFLLAICTVLNTVLSYFAIEMIALTYIAGVGLIPILFMYLAAFVFRFCVYHRIFLDYTVVSTVITMYDYYIGIPVSDAGIMTVQLVLFFVAIVIATICHLIKKYKKQNNEDN